MTEAQKVEMIRRQLMTEAEDSDFNWDLTKEIIWVAKEMGIDPRDIMEWDAVTYDVVRNGLNKIYADQKKAYDENSQQQQNRLTMR